MKIRAKVLLYSVISLSISTMVVIILGAFISIHFIKREEDKEVTNNINKVSMLLESEAEEMKRIQQDWTNWDAAYDFVAGKNDDFRQVNLGQETLDQLELYGMLFFDENMELITKNITEDKNTVTVSNVLTEQKNLYILANGLDDSVHTGFSNINNQLYLVSMSGITTTSGDSAINGYLIMVKAINEEFYEYMGKLIGDEISFQLTDDYASLAEGAKDEKDELKANEGSGFKNPELNLEEDISYRNHTFLTAKGHIIDIVTGDNIYIVLEHERVSFYDALEVFQGICLMIIIVFLINTATYSMAIDNSVVKKVTRLSNFVNEIITRKDIKQRVKVSGNDEIAGLTRNINQMLETLHGSYIEIEENEKRLRLIMEASNDGYFEYDAGTGEVLINRMWVDHLGFYDDSIRNDKHDAFKYIYKDDKDAFIKTILDYLKTGDNNFSSEIRMNKADGGYIWTIVRGKAFNFDENGRPQKWIGSLFDITDRKDAERDRIYLLQTDPITKLKNRAYIETLMHNLTEDEISKSCVLMADVNGLKLINDTLGHKEGDRLIMEAGRVIRSSCMESDTPARWGGDEFLILVRNNAAYGEDLLKKIKNEFDKIDSFPIKINVAMGCASFSDSNCDIDKTIKRAEEIMYRNKLLESRSIRSGIITSLKQTLNEKQIETYEHTERVRDLCLEIGSKLGLSQEELDELELLSLVHDIGKIAIPDNILLKTDALTDDEAEQLKMHTEAGFRIARSIPEISHIAEKILSHHEYYDGSGYPRRITGDEIPVISRILTVVHAFDKLTNDTFNSKAREKEDVINEMNEKAGMKYDPEIVKILTDII